MLFHEFVFVLGWIAYTHNILISDTDDSISDKFQGLLVEKLKFKWRDPIAHIEKLYEKLD